jgi:hypothetical protein
VKQIIFPRPFAFAIDDVGWNQGGNLALDPIPGPYRTGLKRNFDWKDYQAIVDVGKAVGVRVQCLFILSEMDRENILASSPTTTFQRENWDNSFRVTEEQKRIMASVRDNAAHIEFGLHGTGHEYWAPGKPQKRAEWYNLEDKEPWPEESLRDHLRCFRAIMGQYGFDAAHGHSFPESFVPCAYSYYWNPRGGYSLGKLLAEVGVKYANTDFGQIPELNPPSEANGGGFDHGVHVIHRINYGNVWYELASLPKTPLEEQQTDVIESHWSNWLAQDDFLQPEVTQAWIGYYRSVQRNPRRYIAKNTEQLHSQWLYQRYTIIREEIPGSVEIDNTRMPDQAYERALLGNLVLKIQLDEGEHVSGATLDALPVACYFEDEGWAFLYLPPLERKVYRLDYSLGNEAMPLHVFNDGTYSVYHLLSEGRKVTVRLKVYGTAVVRVRCPSSPQKILSEDPNLTVEEFSYSSDLGELTVVVRASDMQGSRGELRIWF